MHLTKIGQRGTLVIPVELRSKLDPKEGQAVLREVLTFDADFSSLEGIKAVSPFKLAAELSR
jgi:bifunctional DNA-binding transcriptional regulator/antitoxin component of YhaV-PrlF toxin-antitoxin module